MGKRSAFPRAERDTYDTPAAAVLPLLPFLAPETNFIEPCAGDGALIRHLMAHGHWPTASFDIAPRSLEIIQRDALTLTERDIARLEADCFITNPPWSRPLLHKLILHLRALGLPAWLLIDANWMFTLQAAPFLPCCSLVVTVGRVKWIPGTTQTGKDDAAWFLFDTKVTEQTVFVGRKDL